MRKSSKYDNSQDNRLLSINTRSNNDKNSHPWREKHSNEDGHVAKGGSGGITILNGITKGIKNSDSCQQCG